MVQYLFFKRVKYITLKCITSEITNVNVYFQILTKSAWNIPLLYILCLTFKHMAEGQKRHTSRYVGLLVFSLAFVTVLLQLY